jgi:magnesium-transporting ATPase (P-type)
LTDKTGTLTQNKMVLRGIFLGDCIFGGEFVDKDGKTTFDPFLDQEKRNRRLGDLDEAFDRRLAHAVVLGEEAPLREPIIMSYQGVVTPILQEPSVQKSFNKGRLSEKTLTHIIQYNGIDITNESTIHRTIIKMRSEKNILLRSTEQPLTSKADPNSSIMTEKVNGLLSLDEIAGDRGVNVSKDENAIPFENLESKSSVFVPDIVVPETPKSDRQLIFGSPLEPLQEEGLILNSYQDIAVEFLMAASLCHDCVVERNVSQKLTYHGPSPDEIAICKGANLIGCKFLARDSNGQCSLDMFGEQRNPTVKLVGWL